MRWERCIEGLYRQERSRLFEGVNRPCLNIDLKRGSLLMAYRIAWMENIGSIIRYGLSDLAKQLRYASTRGDSVSFSTYESHVVTHRPTESNRGMSQWPAADGQSLVR